MKNIAGIQRFPSFSRRTASSNDLRINSYYQPPLWVPMTNLDMLSGVRKIIILHKTKIGNTFLSSSFASSYILQMFLFPSEQIYTYLTWKRNKYISSDSYMGLDWLKTVGVNESANKTGWVLIKVISSSSALVVWSWINLCGKLWLKKIAG